MRESEDVDVKEGSGEVHGWVIRAYVRSRVETVEEVGLDCVVVLSSQQVVHALRLPVRGVTARATRKTRAKHLDYSATTDFKQERMHPHK